MGDGADYNEIERFLNSKSGKEHLNNIRRSLVGKTIADMRFENNTQNVKTVLISDGGSRFICTQPCHDINVIRELFGDVIERERAPAASRDH